jgi:hypothetical protein
MSVLLLSLDFHVYLLHATYISIVNFLMLFQRFLSGEAFLTYITQIRLFSGVNLHMVVQRFPVLETQFTPPKLANVSAFLIVPPLVS